MSIFSRKKQAKEQRREKKKSLLRDWAEALIVAGILALIIRTFVLQAFKIPSGSMEDTLLIGDHLLVNKFIYGLNVPFAEEPVLPIRDPQRGDVIVFEFPEDRDQSYFKRRDFIKRIIGLPGDAISIQNKHVYVNGKRFKIPQEVYKEGDSIALGARDNMPPVTVPSDKYFVMGDNRDRSYDSRFWGFVDRDDIKGLAFIKYWSWDSDKFWPRFSRIGRLIE
ncbi:MAG: signal peptidase I [Deltaproteobacteria bacterium]|jgi:signal peptidase I|nr:signal peptidase I [Deltaproteobacteria bacterium]MBW2476432.1 signal peptidase I [Deltaproteobacteria bacterium]MBW2520966.1 signal peptidase I [Deltaproteobacteria bacterium]